MTWLDTPHLPHGWDCGYLFEQTTSTLLCGDLFTQSGAENEPLVESDILGPSEAMRGAMDYFAHARNTDELLAYVLGTEAQEQIREVGVFAAQGPEDEAP